MLHIALHGLVPLAVSLVFYRATWRLAFGLMMLGMLIDIDHLLADPVYDPNRCSIGFHPLHEIFPMGVYVALFAHEKTRLFGLGLCIHIALDLVDCRVTNGIWMS
ncbi:MAG: DUF6122 family protein [Pseudomonadota bacterium]